MAFRVPTFPLTVNIWRYGNAVANPADVVSPGSISPGRRSTEQVTPVYSNVAFSAAARLIYTELQQPITELLLPKLTDVQPWGLNATAPNGDCVEAPAGSGRFYVVIGVEDVGKGFSNEYRLAWMIRLVDSWMTLTQNPWVVPYASYPLP